MLKPAILFEDALQKKNYGSWHNQEDMFYGDYNFKIEISEDTWKTHQFVSVDEAGEVLGYISYQIDRVTMSVNQLGIISYQKGNLQFLRDVKQVIRDIFYKYNFNRLEWVAHVGNPAVRGYRRFIKRYGGRECGYFREVARLQNGKLSDMITFEILKSDLKGVM
jgi:hypothetical protein